MAMIKKSLTEKTPVTKTTPTKSQKFDPTSPVTPSKIKSTVKIR